MKTQTLLMTLALSMISISAPAAVNCFSDGTVGVVLTTGRQYQDLGFVRITQAQADVYRPDGQLAQSLPGAFLLSPDYAKTALINGLAYPWNRNFAPLPGNPFFLIWCGEMGTPPRL